MNFLDLFLPKKLSSAERARAFLWLTFYYLEGPTTPNPFGDDYSRNNPGKIPLIRRLSDVELEKENVDTPDEIEWGKKMSNQRNAFLQKLVSSAENEKKAKNTSTPTPSSYCYLPLCDCSSLLTGYCSFGHRASTHPTSRATCA